MFILDPVKEQVAAQVIECSKTKSCRVVFTDRNPCPISECDVKEAACTGCPTFLDDVAQCMEFTCFDYAASSSVETKGWSSSWSMIIAVILTVLLFGTLAIVLVFTYRQPLQLLRQWIPRQQYDVNLKSKASVREFFLKKLFFFSFWKQLWRNQGSISEVALTNWPQTTLK